VIAIVYPQLYGVGGIARYLDSFLANLPSACPPVMLITGASQGTLRSYPNVDINHIAVTEGRGSLLLWGLAVRRLLTRLYTAKRIRCINLHIPPLIPGLLLPPGIPMVLTAHTTYLGMSGRFYAQRYYESQWNTTSLAIKIWMERRLFSRAQKVITLTEQGRAEVLSYGFKGPVMVVPNGVDTRNFVPAPDVAKTIDVLFAGRIERRKGSRPMVQLCKSLLGARPGLRISIVGYGEDEEWVRRSLQPLGAGVELAGKISFRDMNGHYQRSRVYVSTSYYEGLPGTCLEAMAMGLPAVVWDFLFYRNLVLDGETGFTIAPDDTGKMTAKILQLVDDPLMADRFGANARALLSLRYDWHSLARTIVGELEAVGHAAPSQ
jgi:glycosyltransferase involved in cell wall biosynthesis